MKVGVDGLVCHCISHRMSVIHHCKLSCGHPKITRTDTTFHLPTFSSYKWRTYYSPCMIDNLHLAGHRTNEYSYRVAPLAGTEGRKSWTRIGTFSSCRPRLTLLDTFCWSSLNSCTSQTCCSPYSFGTFHQVSSCSCQCSHTILGELQELHILLRMCLNHIDSVSCSRPRPDLLGTSSCHRSYPICRTHTCYNHNRTGNHHLQHHHTL